MTIGQRIAEKRREAGLSQEALGESLGVTRQSISKWEGDGSLPEIDKLVGMSRLFGVSVGWLLGEEDGEQPPAAELSEQQMRLVGEIVSRYLVARERTEGRRRRLGWLAGGAAAVCLMAALAGLAGQLRRVEEQGRSLGETVDAIAGGVEQMTAEEPKIRVDGVPMIVKGENEVTADFDVWDTAIDSRNFTLTFYAYAIPKNYEEGMEAIFTADSGDGPVEAVGTLRPGRKFEAEVTCERTDDIKLFVVFRYPDGSEERQMLGQMSMARTASFSDVVLARNGEIWGMELHPADDPERVFIPAQATYVHPQRLHGSNTVVKRVWLGLFKNRELVAWCTPVDPSETRGSYFNVAEYPDIYGGELLLPAGADGCGLCGGGHPLLCPDCPQRLQ